MSLRETLKLDALAPLAAGGPLAGSLSRQARGAAAAGLASGQPTTAYVRFGFKRLLDIVVALTALLIILPILPVVIVALMIQDGPSVIFSQRRVGIGGSLFECLKFRSMVRDADKRMAELLQTCSASRAEWETTQKLRIDPRIHKVGQIIRKSSLDEIPQLLNVLRGEMSIVGPRPMLPEQVSIYGATIDAYTKVRPGITGLWQVSGRNTLTFQQRVELDAVYSSNVTFLQDMRILARTVIVVLMGHGSF